MIKIKTLDTIDKEIIALCKQGKREKEIAAKLNISLPKVKWKLRQMRLQYDCKNTVSLIAKLIELEEPAQEKKNSTVY